MKLCDCKLVERRENGDPRGSLAVIEKHRDVPLSVQRIFCFQTSK